MVKSKRQDGSCEVPPRQKRENLLSVVQVHRQAAKGMKQRAHMKHESVVSGGGKRAHIILYIQVDSLLRKFL